MSKSKKLKIYTILGFQMAKYKLVIVYFKETTPHELHFRANSHILYLFGVNYSNLIESVLSVKIKVILKSDWSKIKVRLKSD